MKDWSTFANPIWVVITEQLFFRYGRSNHSNIQLHFSTSNHKWTTVEVVLFITNCINNLNGLRSPSIFYSTDGMISNYEFHTCILLSEWIDSDYDRFQSIQSVDCECFQWSKTIIAYVDWFQIIEQRNVQSTNTQLSVSFRCFIPIFSGSEPSPQ